MARAGGESDGHRWEVAGIPVAAARAVRRELQTFLGHRVAELIRTPSGGDALLPAAIRRIPLTLPGHGYVGRATLVVCPLPAARPVWRLPLAGPPPQVSSLSVLPLLI